ncbi:hypothetical protein [Escherichia coli]|uniref:hypothetical protein n=1 Tax=Escherichia coli TaxID=562 RepID=UPI00387E19B9
MPIACAVEQSASGKKSVGIETQQNKGVVTGKSSSQGSSVSWHYRHPFTNLPEIIDVKTPMDHWTEKVARCCLARQWSYTPAIL